MAWMADYGLNANVVVPPPRTDLGRVRFWLVQQGPLSGMVVRTVPDPKQTCVRRVGQLSVRTSLHNLVGPHPNQEDASLLGRCRSTNTRLTLPP